MSDLGGTMNENLRDKIEAALGNHQRHGRGMTYGSPDTCRCDERVYPPKGDADPDVRRDGAFAQHQTDAVLAVVGPELDRLRAEAVANERANVLPELRRAIVPCQRTDEHEPHRGCVYQLIDADVTRDHEEDER